MWAVVFVLEILTLYILSRSLTKLIVLKSETIFRTRKRTMYFVSLIFLPGTFIHESSHLIFAKLLFIPTGEFSLMPKLEEEGINLGHVEIGKTDIFRRFLVGVAPFIVGLLIIFATVYVYETHDFYKNILASLIVVYIVFQIANTMFSSKKDWEGAWKVMVIFLGLIFGFYILGIGVHQVFLFSAVSDIFESAVGFLFIPIIINFGLVAILKVL